VRAEAAFAAALLQPLLPLPQGVKGPADKRYAVYRNNVTVGLVRAMEANFPALRKLLGEVYFAGLAREFVQANPPQSPLMFYYGGAFAAFLEAQADLSDYPYLADVARLEQLWRVAYHEADAPTLQAHHLAALDDSQLASLRLTAHPALALLHSNFAVGSIFNANRDAAPAPSGSLRKAECVIVTRPSHSVELHIVDEACFTFMQALAGGATFADAADAAAAIDDTFDLSHCITTLLVAGAFQPLHV